MVPIFRDRRNAGRRLAAELGHLRTRPLVVLGLPRGGVPVAAEVATALDARLDVIIVRKLGAPRQPELAMGAIGEGGVRVIDERIVRHVAAEERDVRAVEEQERTELERRRQRYREKRPPLELAGLTAVLVDDGIATGSTVRAACLVARAMEAASIVVAVPVAPPGWTEALSDVADEMLAVATPDPFGAIGSFYEDFTQTTDEEVLRCLRETGGSA